MPNIEVHGTRDFAGKEPVAKLKKPLAGSPYLKEVVVTLARDEVIELGSDDYAPAPYLRLVAPRKSEKKIKDIEQRLKPLNMDIEVLYIERFAPKD